MRRIFTNSPFEKKIGYARAVVADGWVFVSGCTGLAPDGPDDQPVTDQCAETLRRIEAALTEAGASLADVVRVNYILPKAADFEACWPILREAFGKAPPAATMIEAGLIDPRMKIEIEVTARLPS
ncbi:MAG: RidA family protein [Mangrovicoccus sp.]